MKGFGTKFLSSNDGLSIKIASVSLFFSFVTSLLLLDVAATFLSLAFWTSITLMPGVTFNFFVS